MTSVISPDRVRLLIAQIRQRLWVRPLTVCLLSIAAVFTAKISDTTELGQFVVVTSDSLETLLSIMTASMLVIATFSVASMVSAYAAASSSATPRAFTLIIADDASQNALSAFVGAFIFSVVALTAVKNGYFEAAGLFVLFVITAMVFGIVVITFVRWVDGIARLGRMGSTIEKVEQAAGEALKRRRDSPTFGGAAAGTQPHGLPVFAEEIGYVQHLDVASLQARAEEVDARVRVTALPGTFVTPDRPLAYVSVKDTGLSEHDAKAIVESFQIGIERRFEDDPRFGLVVLAEIAGRALSPGINDPGTAIDVIGRLVRLFHLWCEPAAKGQNDDGPLYDRVEVPEVSVRDMFDDSFIAIARDGAGQVEVAVRLQKAFVSLASFGNEDVKNAATDHSRLALERSRIALDVSEDLAAVSKASGR